MAPLPVAEEMRETDRWAIEERGIPGMELMERAGKAVAREVAALRPDGPVAVVCGKGNNGGDGFVIARLLREAGREARVLLAVDALLGTGTTGAPRGAIGEAVEALARAQGPVVAVDIPSGVDGSTGEVAG